MMTSPAASSERVPSVRLFAKAIVTTLGMLLLLGGCTWSPFASDKDKDKADAGADAAPEREHCTLKAQACGNSCLDRGSACTDCCRQNAIACDRGESYSFYSCPDAE